MASEDGSNKTALGVSENIAGVLAYFLGWITGIVFLLIEKENKFVRYHAMQSIAVFVPLTILGALFTFIPFLGFLYWIVGLVGFVAWLFLMYQAFQGNRYKVPYAGEWAEKQIG